LIVYETTGHWQRDYPVAFIEVYIKTPYISMVALSQIPNLYPIWAYLFTEVVFKYLWWCIYIIHDITVSKIGQFGLT